MEDAIKRKYAKGNEKSDPIIDFNSLNEQGKKLFNSLYYAYENENIASLRETAKRMRIKSATVFSKEVLIKKMVSKRLLERSLLNSPRQKQNAVTYSDITRLNEIFIGISEAQTDEVSGILKIDGLEAYLKNDLLDESGIYVPMFIVNDFKLNSGDIIKGESVYLTESERFGLCQVSLINNIRVDQYKRKCTLNHNIEQRIELADISCKALSAISKITPFYKGEKKIILGLDALKLTSLAQKISESFFIIGYKTINLFLDQTQDIKNSLLGDVVCLPLGGEYDCDDIVSFTSAYAKNLAESAKDIAIIISNANVLSERALKKVFSVAGLTELGSITVIALSSALKIDGTINKTVSCIDSMAILKRDNQTLINIKKSFTDFNDLLSNDERDRLEKIRQEDSEYISIEQFNSLYTNK